jgi:hypothetical protein
MPVRDLTIKDPVIPSIAQEWQQIKAQTKNLLARFKK